MKEKIQEFYDGLQERLKSPFLLTYLIVWSIHHWRLLFILFTFDDGLNQGLKKSIIETYIENHGGWAGMILPSLGWSILSILTYYCITLAYESLAIGYNRSKSLLYLKLNENRKYILKEEFNSINSQKKALQKRLDELEKKSYDLMSVNGEFERRNSNLTKEFNEVQKSLEAKTTLLEELEKNKKKHDDIIKNESIFINNKLRVAMYQIFEYMNGGSDIGFANCSEKELFFGKWTRTIYIDGVTLRSDHGEQTIHFEENNITDSQGIFKEKISKIQKLKERKIYRLILTNFAKYEHTEILCKVDSSLVIGVMYDSNSESDKFFIVEYKKL